MTTVIDGLREVLGAPQFYLNGALDYGAVFEYFVGATICCIVVVSIFKFLIKLVTR